MKICVIAFQSAVIIALMCIAFSNAHIARFNYNRTSRVSHYKDSLIISANNEIGKLSMQFIDLYNGGIVIYDDNVYKLVKQ